MSDSDRDTLARVYHDYEAAVKAARALWPGAGEGTLREAAADFLVHVREIRRTELLPIGRSGAQSPARGVTPAGEPAPPCPKCRGPMVATGKKTPRMPDYRCADRACDTPMWLKRNGNTHP